jgi:hypothetical protein
MPRVVLEDVEDSGDQFEERGRGQQQDRATLDRVHRGTEQRAAEQFRIDRPQFGQQQGNRRDPADHVRALGDPVEIHQPVRPQEPGRRVLDEMAKHAGDETDRKADAQPQPDPCGDGIGRVTQQRRPLRMVFVPARNRS